MSPTTINLGLLKIQDLGICRNSFYSFGLSLDTPSLHFAKEFLCQCFRKGRAGVAWKEVINFGGRILNIIPKKNNCTVMFAGTKGCEDLCETLNQDHVCLAKLALRRKAKEFPLQLKISVSIVVNILIIVDENLKNKKT